MAWIPPRPLLRAPLRSPPRPRARKQTVVLVALRRPPPLLPLRALQLEALLAQLRPSLLPPLRALQQEELLALRQPPLPPLLRATPLAGRLVAQRQLTLLPLLPAM